MWKHCLEWARNGWLGRLPSRNKAQSDKSDTTDKKSASHLTVITPITLINIIIPPPASVLPYNKCDHYLAFYFSCLLHVSPHPGSFGQDPPKDSRISPLSASSVAPLPQNNPWNTACNWDQAWGSTLQTAVLQDFSFLRTVSVLTFNRIL